MNYKFFCFNCGAESEPSGHMFCENCRFQMKKYGKKYFSPISTTNITTLKTNINQINKTRNKNYYQSNRDHGHSRTMSLYSPTTKDRTNYLDSSVTTTTLKSSTSFSNFSNYKNKYTQDNSLTTTTTTNTRSRGVQRQNYRGVPRIRVRTGQASRTSSRSKLGNLNPFYKSYNNKKIYNIHRKSKSVKSNGDQEEQQSITNDKTIPTINILRSRKKNDENKGQTHKNNKNNHNKNKNNNSKTKNNKTKSKNKNNYTDSFDHYNAVDEDDDESVNQNNDHNNHNNNNIVNKNKKTNKNLNPNQNKFSSERRQSNRTNELKLTQIEKKDILLNNQTHYNNSDSNSFSNSVSNSNSNSNSIHMARDDQSNQKIYYFRDIVSALFQIKNQKENEQNTSQNNNSTENNSQQTEETNQSTMSPIVFIAGAIRRSLGGEFPQNNSLNPDQYLDEIIDQLMDDDNKYGPPPMSVNFLKKLKPQTIPEKLVKKKECCTVCLENYGPNEKVVYIPCNHYFHHECAIMWFEYHCSCPICRREYPTDDVEYEKSKFDKENKNVNLDQVEKKNEFARRRLSSLSLKSDNYERIPSWNDNFDRRQQQRYNIPEDDLLFGVGEKYENQQYLFVDDESVDTDSNIEVSEIDLFDGVGNNSNFPFFD
ncbi:hypothetical protein M0813_27941 [Anaeramoeba flamelloides]|uniref:RING-type domain-containing protein n=1 Tax=Anaeramoeba flamelloides TaxID=1746091 RepID=A0ABQ8XX72_9EUKA|nr:hypothetical protein M0813_27941 [Anaeramoeba flamelloides]